MGAMCRYSYLSGACANKHVDSLECIGLDKCEYSTLNVMTKSNQKSPLECKHDNWLGLYCEKYGRFFCAGQGNCSTTESYHRQLSVHQERLKRLSREP